MATVYSPDYVTEAQLKSLYRPGSIPPSNLTAVIIICIILWPYVEVELLLPWVTAAIVFNYIADRGKDQFNKTSIQKNNLRQWMYRGLSYEFSFGLLWAYACLVFSIEEYSTEYEILNFFIVVGVALSAFARHVIYIPAFFAFSFPVLIAFMFRCILNGGYLNIGIFILSILSFVSFATFARQISREFLENIRLRHENMDLVEKLSKKRKLAEQANLDKSKFFAAASHDVRQPLSALLLHYELVRNLNNDPALETHINNIGLSINALNELFTSFIDISKLDAGIIVPNKQHFFLKTITSKIKNDYALEAKNKGLKWSIAIEDLTVFSDPILIETLIRNLVSNAIRYTASGGVKMTARRVDGTEIAELVVEDTGIGIPESKHIEIFEEFQQLNQVKSAGAKGFGLGLSIVRRIVLSLDLKLDFSSEPESGTCFRLELPLGTRDLAKKEGEANKLIVSNMAGLSVLLVDDDEAILHGIRCLANNWGCLVFTATSVSEALLKVKKSGYPDCMILDYELSSNETGIDIVKHLASELGLSIPTLIISGNITDMTAEVLKLDNCQLIHKPVRPAKIRRFLQQVFNKKSSSSITVSKA